MTYASLPTDPVSWFDFIVQLEAVSQIQALHMIIGVDRNEIRVNYFHKYMSVIYC